MRADAPCGAAAYPVGHSLLELLDDVLRDEAASVVERRFPGQHHRVVVDRVDVQEPRRIRHVCSATTRQAPVDITLRPRCCPVPATRGAVLECCQWRRHGVDWGGHVHPTFARGHS